jgi:hypothetical protein
MTRAILLSLFLVACSGGDDDAVDAPQGADAPAPDAAPNPNACAEPGAVGNEMGVGEYCTSGGGECSDNTGAIFCALIGGGPPICTKPCGTTDQCGTEATCAGEVDGGQMGCVPNCLVN